MLIMIKTNAAKMEIVHENSPSSNRETSTQTPQEIISFLRFVKSFLLLDSISSHCSGNEPAPLPRGTTTRQERTAATKPIL